MILRLRPAIYKVYDIYWAAEWYSGAFRTKPYFEEAFYVGFNIDGHGFRILYNSEFKMPLRP